MPAVSSGRPPTTHVANVGRYAYLSKMVGMPVTYGKKPARGVVMGCWTSDAGEPQFAVLGPGGDVALVGVADVRFYRAEAVVQEAYEGTDEAFAARAARRGAEQERKADKDRKAGAGAQARASLET